MPTEFKVIYTPERDQWEVHYGDQKVGYKAWDQRVALSYAKAMAKKDKPSTILVHDQKGKAKRRITYPEKGKFIEEKIDE